LNLDLDPTLFKPEKAVDQDVALMEAAAAASVAAADKMVSSYDESGTRRNSDDYSTSTSGSDNDYEVDNKNSDPNWSPPPSPKPAINKIELRTRKT